MDTDALIDALAQDAAPVSSHGLQHRLTVGLVSGSGIALYVVIVALGVRPDLGSAAEGLSFWAKAAFPLVVGAAALLLTAQLARPDSERLRHRWIVATPIALLAGAGATELTLAGPSARDVLLLEPSWTCVPLILMLAIPIFAVLIVALRRMAPTRLQAAGAAAGLAASGFAAAIYCLHCEQQSPTYLLTRYGAALALGSLLGALLGPRLLRW